MADICIVYAREDHAVAEKLHELLSQQWETWWDEDITARFSEEIEIEIPRAGCIVVLFSESSRDKDTILDELRLGQRHGIKILPAKLDDSVSPYSFGSYTCTDLRSWNGECEHRGFRLLLQRIIKVVPPKSAPKRLPAIAEGKVLLPSLFLSVSSHETQLVPAEAVRALRVFGAKTILISAYDLVARSEPQAIVDELQEYRKNGGFVVIDSGNYEAFRLDNRIWNPNDLKEALAQTPHDWVFCFDVMDLSQDRDFAVDSIVKSVERDRTFTKAPVLPIVHAPKCEQGGYELKNLPWIIREVAERLEPQLIAIPERELGHGLIARAETVRDIRVELSKLSFYQPLHILGTGNPWSIAVLAAAGADSFDGLEWCRMVVDCKTDRLHHFQHFDLFTYQTEQAESSITREALNDPAIGFAGKVAFHNLDYFNRFAKSMREAVVEGSMNAFISQITDKDTVAQLKKQVPGLLK